MHMDQVTDHLPRIITIHDDNCVYGQTPEEHNRLHIQLMQTTTKNGIVFKSSKLRIRQPEISFYRVIFTSKGMRPDPAKVQALQDFPIPDNQTKFLTVINYLQPFIPSMADKTMFHQGQLAEWDWNPSPNAAFQCLKSWLCNSIQRTTLRYYNRTQPIIVQTDASYFGLGDNLVQNGQTITFATKTLADVKTCYAGIEQECSQCVSA